MGFKRGCGLRATDPLYRILGPKQGAWRDAPQAVDTPRPATYHSVHQQLLKPLEHDSLRATCSTRRVPSTGGLERNTPFPNRMTMNQTQARLW
jgi:hypothetical protein